MVGSVRPLRLVVMRPAVMPTERRKVSPHNSAQARVLVDAWACTHELGLMLGHHSPFGVIARVESRPFWGDPRDLGPQLTVDPAFTVLAQSRFRVIRSMDAGPTDVWALVQGHSDHPTTRAAAGRADRAEMALERRLKDPRDCIWEDVDMCRSLKSALRAYGRGSDCDPGQHCDRVTNALRVESLGFSIAACVKLREQEAAQVLETREGVARLEWLVHARLGSL